MLIFTTTPISCLFFALIKRSYVHKTSKRGWITNCEFYISAILFLLPPLRSFFNSNNTLLLWEGSYKEMFRHASVLHYFQMLFNLRYTIETKSPTVFCPLPNDCTYKLLQQQWLLLTHLFEQVGNMLHFALSNWLRRLQRYFSYFPDGFPKALDLPQLAIFHLWRMNLKIKHFVTVS